VRSSKLWLLCSLGLGAITVAVVLFVAKDRLHQATWAESDVEQMGQILCVFVQDEGRMPSDLAEMRRRGYIETREDGRVYPGRGVVGRSTLYASGPVGLPFMSIGDVTVRWGRMGHGGDVIAVRNGFGNGASIAKRYSVIIAEMLNERVATSTAASAPGVAP
jgi:hypothetical protein